MNYDDVDMSAFPPYQVPPFKIVFPHVPNPDEVADVQDFNTVCRICAQVTFHVYPIFSDVGLQFELPDIIDKHLQIKVQPDDGLPGVVCAACARALAGWEALRRAARLADAVLRRRLGLLRAPGPKPSETAGTTSEDGKFQPTLLLEPIVKNVLTNYFYALNVEEDNSDFEYVCQKCNETPVGCTAEDLTEHLRLNHISEVHSEQSIENFIKGNITFEESLTTAGFDDDDAERDDDKNDVAIPTYCCPYCESIFSSTSRLVCHLGKHVEMSIDNGVICCDHLFQNRKSFVEHLQEKHVHRAIDAISCRTCGFSAEDDAELQAHINENHIETTNTADTVNDKKAFSSKRQRYIPVQCPKCNKTFSNKYNMLVHMKNHNREPSRFTCEKCNKSYRSQGSLTHHRAVVHEGELRYVCASCGEAFPSRTARDVHARLHTGLKPYSCNYCGKSYRAKNTLSRHIDMHLDVRKYACHLCPKKFRKNAHLKYHINTHGKK